MGRERTLVLILILCAFGALAIVFFWQEISHSRSTFLAGTNPLMDSDTTAEPTLPPVRATDPARGKVTKNSVTIVEFADFSCLYCRLTETELTQAISNSSIPVRLVWRDLPIVTEQPQGLLAALAGRCANAQGKFWEMHDAMFQLSSFDFNSLKNVATNLKMNPETFGACLTSDTYVNQIQNDITLARQHNINGAPTIFVGKQVFSGYTSAEQITSAIQEAASAH